MHEILYLCLIWYISIHLPMIRYGLLIFFCSLFIMGSAQTPAPVNGTYAAKYYFIDTSKFFRGADFTVFYDSLKKVEKIADAAGDIEFSGELTLLGYRR